MKIAILHSGNAGFFPRYYKAIVQAIEENGDEATLFSPNSGRNKRNRLPHQVTWGTRLNWFVHSRLYKLTGIEDIYSTLDTLSLLHKLKRFSPDVLHLNLINEKIMNIPLFVNYVNKHHIPIVWTMHDCRAFTGQCPYFDEVNCERWKTGCGKCPQCDTWTDHTHQTWKIRKRWHARIENLTVVTPSQWLANFVKESFLRKAAVKVIYNGVDTDGFSQPVTFDVRREYGIGEGKKIILGCAINWEERKGMKYFEALKTMLSDEYQIVLVGGIDENKQSLLRKMGIICTGRTRTFDEMVAWYQSASVFCNPTLSDNFPTTNIESLAAGTPVVTFNTGGSPEAIDDKTGIVVEQGNVEELAAAIQRIVANKENYSEQQCRSRSQLFSNRQYEKYVQLYHHVK